MEQGKSLFLQQDSNKFCVPNRKRILIGCSETSDLRINTDGIEEIHAVLEIEGDEIHIYGLNSENKIQVNSQTIVKSKLKIGDEIKLGELSFTLIRDEVLGKPLPLRPCVLKDEVLSNENHPLLDLESEGYREYIFEEDEIYPIFKYDVERVAAEVIILFKGKILSIDYIGEKNGSYFISGKSNKINHIEFPYLGLEESFEILKVENKEFLLKDIPSFDHSNFSDNVNSKRLGRNDIHQYKKGELQILVRGEDAPPFVKHAPVLRRDRQFRRYLILCLILTSCLSFFLNTYIVDESLKEEKNPERIAKILYRPKEMTVPKLKTLLEEKEVEIKKKEIQKAPNIAPISLKKKIKKIVKIKSKKGNLNEKKINIVKKGSPQKAKVNKIKKVKVNQTKKSIVKKNKTKRVYVNKLVKKNKRRKRRASKKKSGNVQTYESNDFASTLSLLSAKSGSSLPTNLFKNKNEIDDSNEGIKFEDTSNLAKSNIKLESGSLSGKTKGKLKSSFGTEGLEQSRNIYIAGNPYREIVLGSIDRNEIRRILLENIPQFRYCYQKQLDNERKVKEGVIVVRYIIGATGNVTRAEIKNKSNSISSSVKGCVLNHLKSIQFPRPKGGGIVEAISPLNLIVR